MNNQKSVTPLRRAMEVEMNFQNQRLVIEPPAVEIRQEFVIAGDGQVVISWFAPRATDLILAVWESVTDQPFPVRKPTGSIYCG